MHSVSETGDGSSAELRTRRGLRWLARAVNLAAKPRRLAALMSRLHARVYRWSGGRLLGSWFGQPVLVIETIGRRSGKMRQTTIVYLPDGDDVVVTPANAGDDHT